MGLLGQPRPQLCLSVSPSAICVHPMSAQILRLSPPVFRKPRFPPEGTAVHFIPSGSSQSPSIPHGLRSRLLCDPGCGLRASAFPLLHIHSPFSPIHGIRVPSLPLRGGPESLLSLPARSDPLCSSHPRGRRCPWSTWLGTALPSSPLPAAPHLLSSPPSCSAPTVGRSGLRERAGSPQGCW